MQRMERSGEQLQLIADNETVYIVRLAILKLWKVNPGHFDGGMFTVRSHSYWRPEGSECDVSSMQYDIFIPSSFE